MLEAIVPPVPGSTRLGALRSRSFACSWSHSGAGFAWVRMHGELDRGNSPMLARTLEAAQLEARRVVVDLRELEFMDSAGLHAILDGDARARRTGGQLAIVRGPRRVDALFALTGLRDVLEIVDLDPAEPPVQALLKLCGERTFDPM